MFKTFLHFSFVCDPVVVQLTQVSVVEGSRQWGGGVVEQSPSTLELVAFPLPFIGLGSRRVGEDTIAIHFVILPLPVIAAALGVEEFSESVALALGFESFVACANFILFDDEL